MLFTTPTQYIALAVALVAGWLFGLASHPGGKKWKVRYAAERDAHAATNKRIAELERENARLVKDRPTVVEERVVRDDRPLTGDRVVRDDRPLTGDRVVRDDRPLTSDRVVRDDRAVHDDRIIPRSAAEPAHRTDRSIL